MLKHPYAEVIVDISREKLDHPFTYRIPEEMEERVVPGSVVEIPFGNGNRRTTGYVVGLADRCTFPEGKIKSILGVKAGAGTAEENLIQLAAWMSHTYGSTMIQALKTAVPVKREYRASKRRESVKRIVSESDIRSPDVLTEEQEEAVRRITEEWDGRNRPVLLDGITGSGKTVIYMELAARVLGEGKQAIVLIPEIALTRQTVMRFVQRFGKAVSFMHSRLSYGERYDQMKAARAGEVRVMVGPRSALFTPFPNLGLIVIDEEHEESYHSETMPRYHAQEVAVYRCAQEGGHAVFGSATPSLSSAYRARTGEYLGVTLRNRFGEAHLPETEIVDMRKELEAGNRSILSERLSGEIAARLRRNEQTLLFLNRRGYTGQVTCRTCGHVIKCPHCDVSLTKHKNGRLVCHYCGYEMPDVKKCPECGSPYIGGLTIGTEQVEEIVGRTFPGARILRMDADTTRGKEGHAEILRTFEKGGADILIGTQMVVKGHDFPNVTLVGVLLADLSLNQDDYRASERTYQLVTQAVGRAGRGKKAGKAVIQTYQPDHFAVKAAAAQDYEAFYKEEILYRELMQYPPCGEMAAILGSAKEEGHLREGMEHIRAFIERFDPGGVLRAIGPAPLSVSRVRDVYREVIYIRNKDREFLVKAKDLVERYVAINSGFDDIRIQFDFHL